MMQSMSSSQVKRPFESIATHGFFRVAAATPVMALSRPLENASRTVALAQQAARENVGLVVFPELGITGYSLDDLFFQAALLDETKAALSRILEASDALEPLLVVGAPLQIGARLFNCAIVIYRGRVLGAVPKRYLPNYREFYEPRQFRPGSEIEFCTVKIGGEAAPFGSDLLFVDHDNPNLSFFVEICEDLWTPLPPSSFAALAGANVLINLSASNVTTGKADWRRTLCASQSGRCIAAYIYCSAGAGESTTDLAWDGQALIYENGELLAEGERFSAAPHLTIADLDLDRLVRERTRFTSFNDCRADNRERTKAMRRIEFAYLAANAATANTLRRPIERFPYVPADPTRRDERCREIYAIQIQGLTQRLEASGIPRAVIGISGGLDSAQALLVTVAAFDRLGRPRTNILAYSLPGFATSEASRTRAQRLMEALHVTASEIDIRPAAQRMLEDLGHPAARGQPIYDAVFENVQAGERTSHLFRLANYHRGLVVGTSDLSELALGYTTYGVGDQMAHYSVNASVPKTLIQHLVRWTIERGPFGPTVAVVLDPIMQSASSPELVPSASGETQRAEAEVGPYELQDFFLYYISRYGYLPSKVAFLALQAWGNRERGPWLDAVPLADRHQYDLATIKKWLESFLLRFFERSQFKRSAMPNGPKVGSGGSLSPRSDWRAPSDAHADAWLEDLKRHVP
jgi:NAD+ synthase (glutamine-hydrolysing)